MRIDKAVPRLADVRIDLKDAQTENEQLTDYVNGFLNAHHGEHVVSGGVTVVRQVGIRKQLSEEKAKKYLTPKMLKKITEHVPYQTLKISK